MSRTTGQPDVSSYEEREKARRRLKALEAKLGAVRQSERDTGDLYEARIRLRALTAHAEAMLRGKQ